MVKLEKNKAYFDGMTLEKLSKTAMNVYILVGNDDNKTEMTFEHKLVE